MSNWQVQKLGKKEAEKVTAKPVYHHKILPIWGTTSLVMVLPKTLREQLKINKHDYVRCSVEGNRLIVEKIEE